MDALYGKILKCLLVWFALSNLIFTAVVANSDHDFDRSWPSNALDSDGVAVPANFYINKRLSEFLGGPGRKRFDSENYSNYYMNKRLSEFLGGPGKRSAKITADKKLSEFLGGPGK